MGSTAEDIRQQLLKKVPGPSFTERVMALQHVAQSGVPASASSPQTAAVARAEETLLQQQKQRLQLSAHYLQLRQRMRPPPPIGLAELEKHPLKKGDNKALRARRISSSANASTPQSPPEIYLTPRGRCGAESKRALNHEVLLVEAQLSSARNARPPVCAPSDGGWPRITAGTSPRFYITDVPSIETERRTSDRGTAKPQPPERNPDDFRDAGVDRCHALHYVATAPRLGPLPKPPPRDAASEDVIDFFTKLRKRTRKFDDLVVTEVHRVRSSQREFMPLKAEEFALALEDADLSAAPAEKLMIGVRSVVNRAAVARDNTERLDVYFDHLDRLCSFCAVQFPSEDQGLLNSFVAEVRALVTRCGPTIGLAQFSTVWQLFKSTFSREGLLQLHTLEVLRLLSVMFGMSREAFRSWVHKKLRRYEQRDYNNLFRSEDVRMGRELRRPCRFRVHIGAARFLDTTSGPLAGTTYVRVVAEGRIACTADVPLPGKAVWNRVLPVNLADDRSNVRVQLVVDDIIMGEGSFSVGSFAAGKPLRVPLPTPGPALPNAEVDVTVDVPVKGQQTTAVVSPPQSSRGQASGRSQRAGVKMPTISPRNGGGVAADVLDDSSDEDILA